MHPVYVYSLIFWQRYRPVKNTPIETRTVTLPQKSLLSPIVFTSNGFCFLFHLFIHRFQPPPVSAANNLVDLHCIPSTSHSAYIIDIQYIFLQWILMADFVIIIFQRLFQFLCCKPFSFLFQLSIVVFLLIIGIFLDGLFYIVYDILIG